MPSSINLPQIFSIIMLTIVSAFYVPLLFIFIKNMNQQAQRRSFYRAFLAILERNQDNDEKCISETQIAFKRLSVRDPDIQKSYKSAVGLLEDFLFRVDSNKTTAFKESYEIEVSQDCRKRISKIIDLMKIDQPYASVSSSYNSLFNMLNQALSTNNVDFGKSTLNQLVNNVEILEQTINAKARENLISTIVSIVGVILTIVFGFISIAPYIFSGK